MQIALVGTDQQENLALQYLAGAVEKDGHLAILVRFNGQRDTDQAASNILRIDPEVVGLGISFQYAIDDYLALARRLRRLGYSGHITCGGHVPTFCFESLLEDAPEIDTVVRFEGEETLRELISMIEKGESPRNIAGLVWRENGQVIMGPPRPLWADLDELPFPKRRERPLLIGGIPVVFLLMSRGCMGECAYCSIRAFSSGAGGPRYRLRDVDAIADEIALLKREYSIGIVFVQDDLFILPRADKTIDRLRKIAAALKKRDVHNIVFWIKGRPETITPEVLRAARETGVIHLFLGIENIVDERLRYLGRKHTREDAERAILLCRTYKMGPSFNFMLFDPDGTLEDVAANLDFAEQHLDLPWNVCRTEVYPGTRLEDRLRAEGRLLGDYRAYGYRIKDSRAEIAFRIMRLSFMGRVFDVGSLMNKLISVYFAGQVHVSFFDGSQSKSIFSQIESLLVDFHRDLLEEMRRIIHFAQEADPSKAELIRDWAVQAALEMNQRDHRFFNRYEQIFARLNARGQVRYAQL